MDCSSIKAFPLTENQWYACLNVKARLGGSGLKTDIELWHSCVIQTCMTINGVNVMYIQTTYTSYGMINLKIYNITQTQAPVRWQSQEKGRGSRWKRTKEGINKDQKQPCHLLIFHDGGDKERHGGEILRKIKGTFF